MVQRGDEGRKDLVLNGQIDQLLPGKAGLERRRRSIAVACGVGLFASTLPSRASNSLSVTVGGRRSKGVAPINYGAI